MRIWIDLSNSPHPLLFAPVSRELDRRGHEVLTTARDNAQTIELAVGPFPDLDVIGGSTPRGRAAKGRALAARIAGLRQWARRRRPDLALSHNSYAQIVAARTAGIPAVTAMDFEHQPANHLAFRLAHRVVLPEALPRHVVARQGAGPGKTARYPGLKEEVYLGDFEPDRSVLSGLGLSRDKGDPIVVVRTPPSRALYHQFENQTFTDALRVLGSQPVQIVVLPRHEEDHRFQAALRPSNCVIPRRAIDSRSLLHSADLVIGAGGTMTREAALMGVPTVSVFAGRRPAVDRWLEARGLLTMLRNTAQLSNVTIRPTPSHTPLDLRKRGTEVLRTFVDAVL